MPLVSLSRELLLTPHELHEPLGQPALLVEACRLRTVSSLSPSPKTVSTPNAILWWPIMQPHQHRWCSMYAEEMEDCFGHHHHRRRHQDILRRRGHRLLSLLLLLLLQHRRPYGGLSSSSTSITSTTSIMSITIVRGRCDCPGSGWSGCDCMRRSVLSRSVTAILVVVSAAIEASSSAIESSFGSRSRQWAVWKKPSLGFHLLLLLLPSCPCRCPCVGLTAASLSRLCCPYRRRFVAALVAVVAVVVAMTSAAATSLDAPLSRRAPVRVASSFFLEAVTNLNSLLFSPSFLIPRIDSGGTAIDTSSSSSSSNSSSNNKCTSKHSSPNELPAAKKRARSRSAAAPPPSTTDSRVSHAELDVQHVHTHNARVDLALCSRTTLASSSPSSPSVPRSSRVSGPSAARATAATATAAAVPAPTAVREALEVFVGYDVTIALGNKSKIDIGACLLEPGRDLSRARRRELIDRALSAQTRILYPQHARSVDKTTAALQHGVAVTEGRERERERELEVDDREKTTVRERQIDSQVAQRGGEVEVKPTTGVEATAVDDRNDGEETKPSLEVVSDGGGQLAAPPSPPLRRVYYSTMSTKASVREICLGDGAQKIRDEPNAGGNSLHSEVMSFELLQRVFGVSLLHTEMVR